MNPISKPVEHIRSQYTAVIVGSGYGGAVAASRLARAGVSVALLERGREFVPGAFPRTLVEATEEFSVDAPEGKVGPANGLYWARLNGDISVVSGSGLGGTSLINANVSLRPDARVFRDGRWPAEIAADAGGLLDEGYRRATAWLSPNPYPDTSPELPKMKAHKKSAASMGYPFVKVPINVAFSDRLSAAGVPQAACNLCGDCVSGCNVGSKNTLRMNYLPDAAAHGAEIFCEVEVTRVERKDGRWLVHYRLLGVGEDGFRAPDAFVSADIVLLGAGSLGSTEILLRSKAAGLPVSDHVGRAFTGNADTLGFAFATKDRIDGAGCGTASPEAVGPVGPCITSMVDARGAAQGAFDEMILEEGNIPGPIAGGAIALLDAAADLEGERTKKGLGARLRELGGELTTAVAGVHHGVGAHTQVYLGIGMDDGEGTMSLDRDRLAISWPGVGSQPMFTTINARMKAATAALEGVFVRDPIWTKALGRRLVTVHPLGGCPIGDDATKGAVNHKHLVFTGADASAVHDGLYVVDGAVIPSPLSVNPLLTITALAERCVQHIAEDRGWTYDTVPRTTPLPEPPPPPVGVRFTETMHGFFADAPDFERGAAEGEAAGRTFRFVLTIQADDLDAMLADPTHPARMTGTVEAPSLSADPFTVTGGLFNLFVPDAAQPDTQHMRYRMQLHSEAGRVWYVDGHKNLRDDPGFDMWTDSTTLFTTIYDGPDDQSPVVGRGVLRLNVADFTRQLTTMSAVRAPNAAAGVKAVARFGAFFFKDLWDQYGPGR